MPRIFHSRLDLARTGARVRAAARRGMKRVFTRSPYSSSDLYLLFSVFSAITLHRLAYPMGGYGVSPEELEKLKHTLNSANDELDMVDFTEKARIKNLTTQSVSPYENVEETVDESITKLTEFVDGAYKDATDSMQELIARLHVTISSLAEGVSETGADYQVSDEQVADWLKKHGH